MIVKDLKWFRDRVGKKVYREPTPFMGGKLITIKSFGMAKICFYYQNKEIFNYNDEKDK